MYSLYRLCLGEYAQQEKIAILKDKETTSFDKHCFFIWNPCDTEFCEKKLQSEIEQYIKREITEDYDLYQLFLKNTSSNEKMIKEILYELPFEIAARKNITINDWLKMMSLKVLDTSSSSVYDKLEKIISITGFLNSENILIFPELKNYLSREELEELYKCVLYNEVNLLILDTEDDILLKEYEKGIYIDRDFEEFIL